LRSNQDPNPEIVRLNGHRDDDGLPEPVSPVVPAGILEQLAVPAGELGKVLARLHAVPGVDEAAALSTCNRVEVYAAVSGSTGRVTETVADLMAARTRTPPLGACTWPRT
jgi:Glutamyl-tRNAGlu reductase, N-terminal domain